MNFSSFSKLLFKKPKRFSLYLITKRGFKNSSGDDLSRIRNIGIMAHIDAGKTTTTERMLFYSGRITSMGEVHHGTTVTDYLEQERNRGITIASAFVDLKWRNHIINLVDTPGHIDFTMEVEHALKVIDSAIIILDATAGVEAQTMTVWKQAQSHKLPCLVYINKMDRESAKVDLCLETLESKLFCKPLFLHHPLKGSSRFEGFVDLPSFEKLIWKDKGAKCDRKLISKEDPEFHESLEARLNLIDRLSELDDQLADEILELGSLEKINREQLTSALRRVSLKRTGVPVICGSSYKNIGIEVLLDSIIDYLPSPSDSFSFYQKAPKETLARTFKIIHEKQRGAVVFLRLYSGTLRKSQKVYNATKKIQDQTGKILVPFADDFQEISEAKAGDFVAVTGLKETMTGDLISGSTNEYKKFADKLEKSDKSDFSKILSSTSIPDPVFFCSVEPPSQAYQQALKKALLELKREDPSLQVNFDEATGQTILAGMGELHLEIVKDRIKSNYKIDAELGKIQIVYKEEFWSSVKHTVTLKNTIGTHEQNVMVTLSLVPGIKNELIQLDMTGDSAANLAHLTPQTMNKLKVGVKSALQRGPLYSCEVINVHAVLHWFEAHRATSDPLIVAAASQCISEILKKGESKLLEPYMRVNVSVPTQYSNLVTSDLTRRRGTIQDIVHKDNYKEIEIEAPLSCLLGYAKDLRTMTSGTANLSMQFSRYSQVSSGDAELIVSGGAYNYLR